MNEDTQGWMLCSLYDNSSSKDNEKEPRTGRQKWKSERRPCSTEICSTWSTASVAYNVTSFSSMLHFGKESNKYIHTLSRIGKSCRWRSCWNQAFCSPGWPDLYPPWVWVLTLWAEHTCTHPSSLLAKFLPLFTPFHERARCARLVCTAHAQCSAGHRGCEVAVRSLWPLLNMVQPSMYCTDLWHDIRPLTTVDWQRKTRSLAWLSSKSYRKTAARSLLPT